MNEIRKFRAPDLVLAGRQFTFGQQPPIQRFSKTTVFPGVREMPRQILAAFTTPDDDVRVLFSVHILSARSFAGGFRFVLTNEPAFISVLRGNNPGRAEHDGFEVSSLLGLRNLDEAILYELRCPRVISVF